MSQGSDTGASHSGPTDCLCRDCLTVHSQALVRCPRCGSPRVISHSELRALTIAHIDCDAFYASIEKRDHPELADKPLIVGGGKRGVVSTACYIARIFGVRSAMPMFKALKACPDAVVIKPDMSKYVGVARQIREMMETLTPAVEPLSIDEAFLDLTGTERLHQATPAVVLARFQRRVEAEIGVTVSVGLSHNKFLAKIASDLDKPRGFAVVGKAETQSFLASQPVSLIWGVGAAMQKRLAGDGIWTIGQLQEIDERALARRYGAMGLRLAKLSRGLDARPIVTERMPKTLSAESTFDEDTGDSNILLPHLRELSEKLAQRLKAKDLSGAVIVLKLKTRDFQIRTRTTQAPSPTNLADRIYRTGRGMLLRELDGTKYRLIGIGVAGLRFGAGSDTGDVLDPASVKRAQAEAAMDEIRAKFGRDRLELGLTFRPEQSRSR